MHDMQQFAGLYIDGLKSCLDRLDRGQIADLIRRLEHAWREDRTIFIAGNGGSASTASHMACDLGKTTLSWNPRPGQRRFRVVALNDCLPMLTAWANDQSYDCVFAEQLRNLARPGDLLIVITGSGNSPNIVEAVRAARELGVETVGLLGFDGGKVREMLDHHVLVESNHYGPVEDLHLALNHLTTAYFTSLFDEIARQASPPSAIASQPALARTGDSRP